MKKQIDKLEDSPAWKEALNVAEYMYEKLPDFPIEEEWNTTRKIRNAANDLIFAVSQAIGGQVSHSAGEYDWGQVRRHLFSLKTMYRFACRQKFIELEPEIMVSLDNLIRHTDSELENASKITKEHYRRDMEPWLEKYRLWKEMQE